MGAVWLGKDRKLGGPVAIKFLTRPGGASQARFLEEARIAARLTSPHIVRVFDVGTHLASPFLVMEYLEGETLEERLLATGPLSPQLTVSILGQVASGLSVAHAHGIVHRDLKPANIFLTNTGSGVVAKILDFGVAKVDTTLRTGSGEILGTPHYLSPEQVADASSVDPRSDLWSLAVIAYECVTGRRPFAARSMVELLRAIEGCDPPPPTTIARVPAAFDAWFARALARDPDRRFRTARELISTLQAASCSEAGANAALDAPEPLERTWEASDFEKRSPPSKAPSLPRALRLALLLGGAVGATALLGWWSSTPERDASQMEQREGRLDAEPASADAARVDPSTASAVIRDVAEKPPLPRPPVTEHATSRPGDGQPSELAPARTRPGSSIPPAPVRASRASAPQTAPKSTAPSPIPASEAAPEEELVAPKARKDTSSSDEDLWGVRR